MFVKARRTELGWLLRLEYGDELIETLKQFAGTNMVHAGVFTAIGAVSEIELGFYNLTQKTYLWKTFSGAYELTNGTGNVSIISTSSGEEPFIHMHGTISDNTYHAVGGHVRRLIVGATIELTLTVFTTTLHRHYDNATGLNLWNI